ncbi:MAG: TPD domain-containing protein [Candidatus Helarchaeota archaeon]
MKALRYIKFIQKQRENAIRNSWKLKNITLDDKYKDLLTLSRQLRLPSLLIVRKLLLLENYTKKEINAAFEGKLKIDEHYMRLIKIACKNDFINSPLANKRAKERGLEGELILREWLNHLGLEYDIDPADGRESIPDIVLAEPMKLFGREIEWIESKCSYGSRFDLNKNRKQFDYFKTLGPGYIVFWFGYEVNHDYSLLSGNTMKKILPPFLKKRVDRMLNFVPPEFVRFIRSKNHPKITR